MILKQYFHLPSSQPTSSIRSNSLKYYPSNNLLILEEAEEEAGEQQ
jgi:hypothetical protein